MGNDACNLRAKCMVLKYALLLTNVFIVLTSLPEAFPLNELKSGEYFQLLSELELPAVTTISSSSH